MCWGKKHELDTPTHLKLYYNTVSSSEILEYAIFEISNTGGREIAGAGNTMM